MKTTVLILLASVALVGGGIGQTSVPPLLAKPNTVQIATSLQAVADAVIAVKKCVLNVRVEGRISEDKYIVTAKVWNGREKVDDTCEITFNPSYIESIIKEKGPAKARLHFAEDIFAALERNKILETLPLRDRNYHYKYPAI